MRDRTPDMADNEHLAYVRHGVDDWNTWRRHNPHCQPDLSGANLTGVDLRRADLRQADLRRGILRWANLSGANLFGANLFGANLFGANLGGAYLRATLVGVILSGANLSGAILVGADLSGATLVGGDLSGADLSGAILVGADLSNAILSGAILSGAILVGADLSGATLVGADLTIANLKGTDLRNTSFRGATLIDTCLDGANLSGAKLWEVRRGGWSIKGVICERAFWDRDGKEPTAYRDGDFERIFAEKPRIVLRYEGGMSPVDLVMLPLIVERLQAKHPDCALHIRSVRDDGTGAVVTITVDDRADRAAETFRSEVEALRRDFINFQQQLNQDVRQQIESRVADITLELFERPPRQINVGHFTGYITVEGDTMSRDTYNIHGPTGAIGPHSHAHHMTLQQIWNQSGLDLPELARELESLLAAMKQETVGTAEQASEIDAVDAAEKSATDGDGPTALGYLKTAGKWSLGVAEKIGVAVAAKAIQSAMGMSA